MANPRNQIENATHETFAWIDYDIDNNPFDTGEKETLELRPPMSSEAVLEFAALFPASIPPEINDLLQFASGFTLGSYEVEFTARNEWGYDFLLPNTVVLADDGTGNSWAIETNAATGDWRHVWFVCHDPPVMIYQCSTLARIHRGRV